MLQVECQEYFDQVKEFAAKAGKMDNLQAKLDYLANYACGEIKDRTRCRLFKDFAPQSFSFLMESKDKGGKYTPWFNGGLIFHGAHDGGGNGGAPTFSVCLSPTDGWSIHT